MNKIANLVELYENGVITQGELIFQVYEEAAKLDNIIGLAIMVGLRAEITKRLG